MREDEAIPIVIGNTMYLGSPYGAVIALDATTGAEKWRFQLPDGVLPSKRGGRLLAGWRRSPAPAVHHLRDDGGRAVLTEGVGRHAQRMVWRERRRHLKTPEVMQTGPTPGYSLLSSPSIYKNLIITGAAPAKGRRLQWRIRTRGRYARLGRKDRQAGLDVPYRCRGRGNSALTRGAETAPRTGPASNVWGYTSLDTGARHLYMPLGAPEQ
jgi:quinoprotein glucose dehydrogenase